MADGTYPSPSASAVTPTPVPAAQFDAGQTPLVPGANIVGRGIYIKAHEPYELKAYLSEPERAQAQIYTSHETRISYIVPANCVINESPPMTSDQSLGETVIEESWDRFGNQLKLNASAAAGNSLISIDPSGVRLSDLRSDSDSYYALRNSFIAFWNLSLINVPAVDALDKDAESLPSDPLDQANRPAYRRIFEKYGSHYVKSVWVGGKASLAFVTAKSSQLSREEIRSGIQASVGGMLKTDLSSEEKKVSDRFKSNSTCKVFGSGGNRVELAKLTSLDPQTYGNWIESVKDNPQPIQFGLVGIWTLLTDRAKADTLQAAYLQESRFTPLTSIVPAPSSSEPRLYFIKDDGIFEYRLKTKPGEPKTTRNPEFSTVLMSKLQSNPSLAKFVQPDAAISLDGFSESLRDSLYLFRHGQCVLCHSGRAGIVADGYPRPISVDWPGVDFIRIDAALTVAPDRVYFFRGSEYIRVDVSEDGRRTVASRDLIRNRWAGVTFDRVDTAVYWGNSKAYLFSGDQYIRYDMSVFKSDPGYPKYLKSNYVEDWEIFE